MKYFVECWRKKRDAEMKGDAVQTALLESNGEMSQAKELSLDHLASHHQNH